MIMTLNDLINKACQISRQLSSGEVPVTINGLPLDFVISLEGENGNYFVDIKFL